MTKNFTCCELVEGVKDFLGRSNWTDKEKYQGLEFINKASHKIINRRIKEWVSPNGYPEPVGTHDSDYLFCEKCRKWFEQKEELQHELIMAQIEKEKREGTFYSKPEVQEILKENKQKFDEWEKKLRLGKNNELNFGKSPQEYS